MQNTKQKMIFQYNQTGIIFSQVYFIMWNINAVISAKRFYNIYWTNDCNKNSNHNFFFRFHYEILKRSYFWWISSKDFIYIFSKLFSLFQFILEDFAYVSNEMFSSDLIWNVLLLSHVQQWSGDTACPLPPCCVKDIVKELPKILKFVPY